MQWVLVSNDNIRLNRLSNILSSNGFSIHTRQINFDIYYCFHVPYQYDIKDFANKLPVINDIILKDRIIMIKL